MDSGDEDQYTLREADFRDFKRGTTIAIVGKRHSGKTTVIKNICYYMQPYMRICMLVSGTANVSGEFDSIIPPLFIYEDYIPSKIKTLMRSQAQISTDDQKRYMNGKKMGAIVIMDDVVSQSSAWRKDPQFIKMFLEGRHFHITNILSVHDVLNIPSGLRSSVDYMIITSEHRRKRISTIFDNYWPQKFGDKKIFESVLSTGTDGWKSLLIDIKKSSTPGAKFSNSVKYLKPPHPDTLPRFRMGLDAVWKTNRKYYNKKWRNKSQT